MKLVLFAPLVAIALVHTPVDARAERLPPSPFTTTLSNHTPLVFGMSVEDATEALEKQDLQIADLITREGRALVLAFNSFTSALIIGGVAFFSVGLAMLAIWLFGFPMGFTGIMGAMGLIGLAINDSIVVLAALRANERARAADPEAIVDIVVKSSRHIISTTLTTVGGFMPLIIWGGGMWPPLATAISGGMVGATLLALIFVPTLYYLRVKKRAQTRKSKVSRNIKQPQIKAA